MTTRTHTRQFVEFLAASPRIARAYRVAARHNKVLNRQAKMHELGHRTAGNGSLQVRDQEDMGCAGNVVVLGHADEDCFVPTEGVLAGAFYLLFTGPTTHPDQILRWARRAGIRSEHRLHVVKVEDLESPMVSHLLGRVCIALAGDETRGSIIDAYAVGDTLIVRGPKLRILPVPMGALPSLRNRPVAVRRNFEIDPDGSFLYWPDLDVHLGWNQFLQAVDPEAYRKAQQRSARFNERYGAAIRKLREHAGIAQAQIPGLTERQVRRIEQGESRATSKALAALARTHALDTSAYLEKLANAMS